MIKESQATTPDITETIDFVPTYLPARLPCPSWCTDSPGHAFEQVVPGGLLERAHTRPFCATEHVELVQMETARDPQGPSMFEGRPVLSVGISCEGPAARVRALGNALLEAARYLESITGAVR